MTHTTAVNSLGWEVQMLSEDGWENAITEATCKQPDEPSDKCFGCDCEFVPTVYSTYEEAHEVMVSMFPEDIYSGKSEVRVYESLHMKEQA